MNPIVVFWVSLGTSGVLAFPIFRLLLALKSRQTVSQYAPEGHQVKQGTPTMGGLITLAGILCGLVYFALLAVGEKLDPAGPNGEVQTDSVWALVGLTLAFAAIGFIDDFVVPRMMKGKRGLGWKQKIVMQFLAAALAIPALELTFTPVNAAVVLFVVLFFSNAYNFADGLDGLAASLGILLFTGVGVMGLACGAVVPVVVSLVVIGGLISFLFLNAPPAKVFMGDVGSLPIGALLGFSLLAVTIRFGGWAPDGFVDAFASSVTRPALYGALALFSLMMIAELVPVPLQILSVKLRKKKLFPYTPIHHAFEKAGWPESRVVWLFALVQFLCVAGALSLLFSSGQQPK